MLFTFFACEKSKYIHNENKNLNIVITNKNDTTKLSFLQPFGEKKLIDYHFPKEWNNLEDIDDSNPNFTIDKISSKGYDSIFYFIEKNEINYYNSLKTNNSNSIVVPKKKLSNILNLYEKNVILDKTYYVETISKTPKYTLELYKSGDKYKDILTNIESEKFTFEYLFLVTLDNSKNPIDYILIYYNNYNSVMGYKRFLYIDKKLNIYLKDFVTNEVKTSLQNEKMFKINNDGYFN